MLPSTIPTNFRRGERILSTPAGWHICRKALAGIRTPAGCYIPPFQSANLFQGCSFLLMQNNIAPRWGAAAATRSSTNMPPRLGGEDFFTSSSVVGSLILTYEHAGPRLEINPNTHNFRKCEKKRLPAKDLRFEII